MSQTQTRRSSQVDLLHGPILKSLLLFALPIMASRVFQQIYNTMDTLIVGYTLGDSSIAAMGACSSIYEMMTGFTFGVGNGLAIVTARCFGRQETDRMKKSVASCIVIGVAVTLVVTILATIFMHPLLRLLKTPAEILEESYSYISILSIFLFVMFAYNLCSGLLRAIGNSFMPLVFLIFSSLVNIVLDLLFIRTFGMGVRGAALAQGVHVHPDICPLIIIADGRIAHALGTGAGDLVFAGHAVAHGAGLAVLPDALAGIVQNISVIHIASSYSGSLFRAEPANSNRSLPTS